jgi:hypothetical protein
MFCVLGPPKVERAYGECQGVQEYQDQGVLRFWMRELLEHGTELVVQQL